MNNVRDVIKKYPSVPEREIRVAFAEGCRAYQNGRPKTACPFALPDMQNAWLAGYESAEGFGR